jgi:uncharacterized protein YqhQ
MGIEPPETLVGALALVALGILGFFASVVILNLVPWLLVRLFEWLLCKIATFRWPGRGPGPSGN